MRLNKKINDDTLTCARYAGKGIALSVSGKGDKYTNSIAIVEYEDGELRLTLFDDAIDHYGIKIAHEKTNPEEW